MSQIERPFRRTSNGYFMEIRGPALNKERGCCEKKLCFVATDQALLTEFNGLSTAPGDPAADSGSLQMPLQSGGPGMSALLAY